MDFSSHITTIIEFVRANQQWAAPIAFTLAFLESLAFLSLLIPSTAILVGISGLIGAAGIGFWPVWLAGGLGGVIGYSVSYWLGVRFKEPIFRLWPFSRNPALIDRSRAFFEKWGALSVFFGHFFGPVRAIIPVMAGAGGLNHFKFELANFASAFLWITIVMTPGYTLGESSILGTMLGTAR